MSSTRNQLGLWACPLTVMASAIGAASPALALQAPDLALSMTASAGTVNASAALTYSLTVRNLAVTARVCEINPDTHKPVCTVETVSADAQGVVVTDTLPSGVVPGTPSGDSGFFCNKSSATGTWVVTCANGSIAAGDAAHITIPVTMPNAGGTLTNTAIAGGIAERNNNVANNSAAVTTTVNPPVNNNLPDFNCSETAVNTFDGISPVDFSIFLRNMGPVSANNITLRFGSPFTSGLLGLSANAGFSCWYRSGAGQALEIQCDGGTIPAYGSAFMTVRIAPSARMSSGQTFSMYTNMDPDNLIAELSEFNNGCTKAVIVSP